MNLEKKTSLQKREAITVKTMTDANGLDDIVYMINVQNNHNISCVLHTVVRQGLLVDT